MSHQPATYPFANGVAMASGATSACGLQHSFSVAKWLYERLHTTGSVVVSQKAG